MADLGSIGTNGRTAREGFSPTPGGMTGGRRSQIGRLAWIHPAFVPPAAAVGDVTDSGSIWIYATSSGV